MARYIDADMLLADILDERIVNKSENAQIALRHFERMVNRTPTADVAPRAEVEKIFEKLKVRECSNSVCAWCVHATAYGRRSEECDKPYIDKNGKEQKACYVYDKFESLIDNEFAELKKKYTEGKYENQN